MKTIALSALIVALTAPVPALGTAAEPSRLSLAFEASAPTGAVMVTLFDSEAAYAGGAPVRQARIDLAKGERTAVFGGLQAGNYAVKAFHDVNGDGRMNANPFGVPIEPVAFSNNAPVNMGAPGWDKVRFEVRGATAQTIKFR